jgi:uncharacterized membrane protein YfbV (UPF0208 family)
MVVKMVVAVKVMPLVTALQGLFVLMLAVMGMYRGGGKTIKPLNNKWRRWLWRLTILAVGMAGM